MLIIEQSFTSSFIIPWLLFDILKRLFFLLNINVYCCFCMRDLSH